MLRMDLMNNRSGGARVDHYVARRGFGVCGQRIFCLEVSDALDSTGKESHTMACQGR